MNKFERAYLECALWSSTDESDDSGGEPLDKNYSIEDFSPECLAQMLKDCANFQESNAEMLAECGLSEEQSGHDFWLTRNRHGAGFWDRGLPVVYDRALTESSRAYGSFYLYVGDDGQIHC